MADLIFTLNKVLPIILIMVIGYLVKKVKLVNRETLLNINKLVFRVFLPTSIFMSLYNSNDLSDIDLKFVLFVLIGTTVIFIIGLFIAKQFIKDDLKKGPTLQAFYRANYAIIGIALTNEILGYTSATAAFAALIGIPLFNVYATIALTIFIKDGEKVTVKSTLIKILKNPIVIPCILGCLVLLIRMGFQELGISFRLKDIEFLYKAATDIGKIASPIAIFALGGLFEFSQVSESKKELTIVLIGRLIVVPFIMLFIGYKVLNFDKEVMAVLIGLFAAPVATSSAVMAKEMKNDGDYANQIVVWSTLLSMITIFVSIYVFRILGVF